MGSWAAHGLEKKNKHGGLGSVIWLDQEGKRGEGLRGPAGMVTATWMSRSRAVASCTSRGGERELGGGGSGRSGW
jgi:hypothetical protein